MPVLYQRWARKAMPAGLPRAMLAESGHPAHNCVPMKQLDLLKTVELFTQLSEDEILILADHAEFLDFADGDEVFATNSTDRELFVIESGEVRIVKKGGDGHEIDLARFVTGESFGEQDFMSDSPRTAWAVSEGASRLLVFPARGSNVDAVMHEHPEIFARVLHQLLVIVADRSRSTNKLVSENSSWVRELRQQVFGDKLTGLYSKDFLDDEFAGLLGKWKGQTGFLMIKPDNFKLINDTYGHDVGDQALRILANQLKALLRDDDIAVRYRGNENAAILPETEFDEVVAEARRIQEGMKQADLSPITGGADVSLTFSIGVAVYPDDDGDNVALASRAHDLVFQARDAGGDKVLCSKCAPEDG
jgi:diguanylate cyclase (GGDEF)-like protein